MTFSRVPRTQSLKALLMSSIGGVGLAVLAAVPIAAGATVLTLKMMRDPSISVPSHLVFPLPRDLELVYRLESGPNGAGLEINNLYLVVRFEGTGGSRQGLQAAASHLEQRGWSLTERPREGETAAKEKYNWWSLRGWDSSGQFSAEVGDLSPYLEYLDSEVLEPAEPDDIRDAVKGKQGQFIALVLTPVR